jgi:hypothetical protein
VEGCPERIGEDDDPDEEEFLRGIWEDGDDQDFVLEALRGGVEVRTGRPRTSLTGPCSPATAGPPISRMRRCLRTS